MGRRWSNSCRVTLCLTAVTTVLAAAAGSWAGTQPSAQAGEDGAALYRTYCASCHGIAGRGDGPVAEFLRVPPADLTRLAQRTGGALDTERVAQAIDGRQRVRAHGPTDMPVWGDTLSPTLAGADADATRRRIEALVRHIASIQRQMARHGAPDRAVSGR